MRLALVFALGLAAPAIHAQSTPGGTIVGATSRDDVGGQAKSIADLERERKKELDRVRAASAAVRSTDDSFNVSLLAAQEAMKAGKSQEALTRLNALEATPGISADEAYLVARNRVAAASLAGNETLLLAALESVMRFVALPPGERIEFGDVLVRKYFNRKDYPLAAAAAKRYFADGGNDPAIRRAMIFSYYLGGQIALADRENRSDIAAMEAAGNKPGREQLRLLVSCAQKLDDKVATASALEKYNAAYPK